MKTSTLLTGAWTHLVRQNFRASRDKNGKNLYYLRTTPHQLLKQTVDSLSAHYSERLSRQCLSERHQDRVGSRPILLKCSVGWAIPAHEYDKSFEGYSIRAIQHHIPSLVDADTEVLMTLQEIHRHPSYEWSLHFKEVFRKYNLPFPSEQEYYR